MTINTTIFRRSSLCAAVILALPAAAPAFSATLAAGPGKAYSTPCGALTAAADGDTVEIDGANYDGDVCVIRASNLTIRGVNGRPKINASGQNAVGKGTWVLYGANTTIDNVELSGAAVPDENGAALRLDAPNLTLRNSYIHHNENGILTDSNPESNVVIENTEFSDNGRGTGYTHNLYIGNINSLIFRGSYSHDANVGHNLKSRARTNTIVYSRFSASYNQPSYEIDLPNAGTSYIIGNVIQQPASNDNPSMLAYGEEGPTNTGNDLYVVNNTFINDDSSRGTFIMTGSSVSQPVLMQNNLFVGTGTVITQANATDRSNYRTLSAAFVDRANYDLRPASGSPVINAGTVAGASASGLSLLATSQYKHVAGSETRTLVGAIDIGAYEAAGTVTAAPTPTTTTSPTPTTTTTTTTWVNCANENGLCSFSGTRQVRYGANGSYGYKSATGSISCSNDVFGDPIWGVAKTCSYADSSSTSTTTTPVVTSPVVTAPTWTRCSGEGGTCSFTGTRQVRYGANGVYATKSATGAIACTNDVFGDPIWGVVKSCEYQN